MKAAKFARACSIPTPNSARSQSELRNAGIGSFPIIALSSFLPIVAGFELDLSPPLPPVAIGHGTLDPVIEVEWGRRARATLEEAGAEVLYRETPMFHQIDPDFVRAIADWLPV